MNRESLTTRWLERQRGEDLSAHRPSSCPLRHVPPTDRLSVRCSMSRRVPAPSPSVSAFQLPENGGPDVDRPPAREMTTADHEPCHPPAFFWADHLPCRTIRLPASSRVQDPRAISGVSCRTSALHVPRKARVEPEEEAVQVPCSDRVCRALIGATSRRMRPTDVRTWRKTPAWQWQSLTPSP